MAETISRVVDESVTAFWEQVADTLRNRISSQDWCSWFAGAAAIELGAERIVVEVVNVFAARFVDGKFRPVLEQVVAETAGVSLEVVIVARSAMQTAPTGPAEPDQGVESGTERPHEDLARAARARVGTSDLEPAAHAEASSTDGAVMTEAELRAALAASDLLPDRRLDAGDLPVPGSAVVSAGADSAGGAAAHDAQFASVLRLNDRYRFDTFVIGPGNQMVHAAALSVAESPAQSYNPLFLHGSTGVGKTHLLHAIGNYVRDTRPDARIAYITTEQFFAQFMHAIQQSRSGGAGRDLRDRFKAFFRGVDVLLMDDVQFLGEKGSWIQEELFHIFNALHERGSQIVLTSDCKPEQIVKLEDRLRSRFAWGLIADIEVPDRGTRVAILRKKAQVDSIGHVPDEVFEAIAELITSNVRELEGALTRVVAAASLSSRDVTLELAHTVLESYASSVSEPVTIERIQDVVCEHFALDRTDLLSSRRTTELTLPRQIGMYLSRTMIGAASTQVAKRFNRKDHSTVLHAERKIDERMRQEREVHDLVVRLTEQVRSGRGRAGAER